MPPARSCRRRMSTKSAMKIVKAAAMMKNATIDASISPHVMVWTGPYGEHAASSSASAPMVVRRAAVPMLMVVIARRSSASRGLPTQCVGLELLELLRRDRALLAKLGSLGDLIRGGIAADATLHLLLLLDHSLVLLGHLRTRDHVDEDSEEGQDHDEEDPARLPASREVVAAEDVAEDRDEHPDEEEPEEEGEHREEDVAEVPLHEVVSLVRG